MESLRLRGDGRLDPRDVDRRVGPPHVEVPTGELAKYQGVDGVFEAPSYKVARVQIGTQVFTDVVAPLDILRQGYRPVVGHWRTPVDSQQRVRQ
jgi:hypothetical protein